MGIDAIRVLPPLTVVNDGLDVGAAESILFFMALMGCAFDIDARELLAGSSKLTHFFYLDAPYSRLQPAFKTGNVGDGDKEIECLLGVLI